MAVSKSLSKGGRVEVSANEYDVLVVGAGLAGLTVASLLARGEGKRVAVLEREDFIGGRLLSFTGEGDHLLLQGKKLDVEGFRKALRAVYTWVGRSNPDLETIMKKGLLDGYTFEAGGHATFWGTKGRVAHLLSYIGKEIDLPGNQGFAVIDPASKALYPVQRGGAYGWMDEESNHITKELLREMALADEEKLKEWDTISFGKWLKDRTDNRKVYEYLAAIASIHMVMGEPDMIPAGDFIRFMTTAVKIGMNLVQGSTGIVPRPGFIRIAELIAETVEEGGGKILTGHEVKEVLVEDGRVTGARVAGPGGEETFGCRQLVCTVPVRKIWGFIPRSLFPGDFVRKVEERFFSVGMLTGYMGLNRNVLEEAGINPKSWLLAPAIIKSEEGYIGDVDIISIMPSSFTPTLAPPDKHTLAFSIALTEGELHDRKKVDRVIDASVQLFEEVFPSLSQCREWEIWTCSDKGFGDWPPPGEKRPDVVCPYVQGLYFSGDGYGEKTWGSGMDAAVLSALLCVDAMCGSRYTEEVLPEYHR